MNCVIANLSTNATLHTMDQHADVESAEVQAKVKRLYRDIDSLLVKSSCERLGIENLVLLDRVIASAVLQMPYVSHIPSAIEAVDLEIRELALRSILWVEKKIQQKIPSQDAKRELAVELAQDFNEILGELSVLVDQARKESGKDWGDPLFDSVLKSIMATSKLAKRIGTPEEFYSRLAGRVTQLLDKEVFDEIFYPTICSKKKMLGNLIHWVGSSLSWVASQIAPDFKQTIIYRVLLNYHMNAVNSGQLKFLMGESLNACSRIMQESYEQCWKNPLEAPFLGEKPHPVFGQATVQFLRILNPTFADFHYMPAYEACKTQYLQKDELAILLGKQLDHCITQILEPTSAEMITSALKIVQSIQCQIKPNSLDQHVYEAKSTIEVDKKLREGCVQISKWILRTGLIRNPLGIDSEGFVKFQRKCSSSLSGIKLLFARIQDLLVFILENVYRIYMLIVSLITHIAARLAGEGIYQQINHFCHSPVADYLIMCMIEKKIERMGLVTPAS